MAARAGSPIRAATSERALTVIMSVYIDDSLDNYGRITVDTNGAMCVRDRDLKGQTVHLYVQDILVKGQGRLQIGSKDAPIGSSNRANNVRIMFKGEAPKTPHDASHSMNDDQPCPDPNFKKGLQLCKDGVLQLFGSTGAVPENSQRAGGGKVSWTYLSQPAGDPCRYGPNSGAGSPVTNEGCSVWPGGRTREFRPDLRSPLWSMLRRSPKGLFASPVLRGRCPEGAEGESLSPAASSFRSNLIFDFL